MLPELERVVSYVFSAEGVLGFLALVWVLRFFVVFRKRDWERPRVLGGITRDDTRTGRHDDRFRADASRFAPASASEILEEEIRADYSQKPTIDSVKDLITTRGTRVERREDDRQSNEALAPYRKTPLEELFSTREKGPRMSELNEE